MGGKESVWGHNTVGWKWVGGWINPKPIKEFSLRAESYEELLGRVFSTVSQVLWKSIVALLQEKTAWQIQMSNVF